MQNILERVTKYSIYVLVFLMPLFWLPFSFEAFEYSKQYLLFFLVSLGFFSWLIKMVAYDKEIRFRKSAIDYLVLGFLFISIISVVFSADKYSSIFGLYGRFSNGLIGLLGLGALYFLITNNVGHEEVRPPKEVGPQKIRVPQLIKLFLWSSGLAVLAAYFSIFQIWQKLSFLPQIMFQKTFNPISGSLEGLAVFLSIVAVLLTGLLLNKSKDVFYWILLAASMGLLAIVDFTPAWMVLFIALALSVGAGIVKRIFRENVNKLLIPIFLIIISIAFVILQPFKMNLPKEQVLGQQVSWQVALKSATDSVKNGFLGSGIGTFQYDFSKHKPQTFNQTWMWQIRFDRAGSYLSELLATGGFLSFLIYLGLVGLFLMISWFFITKQFSGLPLLMGFTALLVGQFFYYQNTSLAFAFWLFLGASVVSWQTVSTEPIQGKKLSFKNLPELSLLVLTSTIIFGVVILAFYFYGARYYLADVHYSKALSVLGEERVKELEAAARLNPGLTYYRTILSRAYLSRVLDETQKPQADRDSAKIQLEVAKAIDQARLATALGPNQVANWETLGMIYREIQGIAAGANEWGIKSFETAIKLESTNPVLYTELGKLYIISGNKEQARNNFDIAIEKKSDYVTALIQLALLLEQENILDEAVARLENVVQNNPYNIEARFQLGRLYFNNKKIDEAIGQFQVAVLLEPNHSNAHYSLGVAYAAKKEVRLAIQEFEKVLELNPGNPDIMQKIKELKGE